MRAAVLGVAVLLAFGAAAASAAPAPRYSPRDFSGVWEGEFLTTLDFPYSPAYAAVFKQRQQDDIDNKPYDDPASHCLTSGMPATILSAGYLFEFFMGDKQVTVLKENGSVRRIQMKRGHIGLDEPPTYMGDSIGRWEGDVLVVDTVHMRADTSLERRIAPHSDALHVVERITRPSYGVIKDEVTLTDPKAFTKPWVHTVTLRRHDEWEAAEFVCENNRYFLQPDGHSAIVGVAK